MFDKLIKLLFVAALAAASAGLVVIADGVGGIGFEPVTAGIVAAVLVAVRVAIDAKRGV